MSNTRIDIAYYISEYTYHSNNYCTGDGNGYGSLESAKSACANNSDCQCIFKNKCTGNTWYTRTGSNFSSPSGSCAWVKRKLTFPNLARKLIYQIFLLNCVYFHTNLLYDTSIIENVVPPINCEWNEWQIGECSNTCEGGMRLNNRTKKVEEMHGGICEGENTVNEPCNTQDCPGRISAFNIFTFRSVIYT